MNPEVPFLEAIRAAPHDTATRLVYADWLEERGDARAELIRIEEAMGPLPVFSDRFWQLKPRRYELLRRSFPVAWLETMRYEGCPPTFAHVPNGWKEWWRLIRVLAERWVLAGRRAAPLADVGGRTSEASETEARLRVTLPPALREWLAFRLDVWPSIGSMHTLEDFDDGAAIALSARDAIRTDDLDLDDPPVVRLESCGYSPVSQHLSAYELKFALGYVNGEGGGFDVTPTRPDSLVQDILADFPVHFQCGHIEIFETDNVMVVLCHLPGGPDIFNVEVASTLKMEAIPRYLREQLHHARSAHGMFAQ